MREITGYWFAPLNSERFDARLTLTSDQYQLTVGGQTRLSGQLTELDISDRTGNITRRINFPDDSLFETQDNDGVDEVLANSAHKAGRIGILHHLESSLPWVFVALFVTAGATFSFFKWGLPALSGTIAHSLPVSVHENVAAGSMKLLDKIWFEESQLTEQEQADIQTRFDKLISHLDTEDFTFRLYFRQMRGLPNALALPSGEIIVTDALAKLVDPPEELDAVLMHEIGHVLERHGMQHVIQASTMALVFSLAVGDVSGSGELIAGVPAFLLQSNYSRKSEASADAFAFRELSQQGIDPAHFATIILKLQNSVKPIGHKKSDSEEDRKKKSKAYLSTHPDSELRAQRAREYSRKHFVQ